MAGYDLRRNDAIDVPGTSAAMALGSSECPPTWDVGDPHTELQHIRRPTEHRSQQASGGAGRDTCRFRRADNLTLLDTLPSV